MKNWAVVATFSSQGWRVKTSYQRSVKIHSTIFDDQRCLVLPSDRPYRPGTFINPRNVVGVPRKKNIIERLNWTLTTTPTKLLVAAKGLQTLSLPALWAMRRAIDSVIETRLVLGKLKETGATSEHSTVNCRE